MKKKGTCVIKFCMHTGVYLSDPSETCEYFGQYQSIIEIKVLRGIKFLHVS